MSVRTRLHIAGLLLPIAVGCGDDDARLNSVEVSNPAEVDSSAPPDGPETITFKDELDPERVESSLAEVPAGLDGLVFVDTRNSRVALEDFVGKKNVLLVFTEGFTGMLCPFCKAQTSRLIANYDQFAELDTEVLVVYPGTRDHLDEFLEAARTTDRGQVDRVPFPIVLDEDLTATRFFEIESKLAHPSTYIIDKRGKVRFAYVGEDMSPDRPSVKALLEELRKD